MSKYVAGFGEMCRRILKYWNHRDIHGYPGHPIDAATVFSMDVTMSSSALRQETPCSPASAKYSRRKEVMKKRFRSLLNSSPVKCSNMFFSTYFSCGCTETDFYPWLHFVRRENQRDICCSFFQSTCQKCIQHCSEIDIYLYTYFIYVDM